MVEGICKLHEGWRSRFIEQSSYHWIMQGEISCSSSTVRDWKLNWLFEYMPREHNHLAKLDLTLISRNDRALSICAYVPWKHWFHLYREAFKIVTDLDGPLIVSVYGKRAAHYQHMFWQNPIWAKHLRLFGESGTVIRTCNSRGFIQIDDEHYNSDNISSLFICVMLVCLWYLMDKWTDWCEGFLCVNFQEEKLIYMKVPKGFEKCYQGNVLFLLLWTMCEYKQAERAF